VSTLTEIEAAVEKLDRAEQAKLLQFIEGRLRTDVPRDELLAKWRARSSGIIEKYGGVQAYINMVRGRDDHGD
jgi:hypothetical protein